MRRLRARVRPEAWRIFCGLFAGAVLSVGYASFAPRWYQSRLVAVPTASRSPSLSLNAEGVGGSADVDLSGNSEVERIAAILQSGAVSDAIVEWLGLQKRYGVAFADRARAALWSHCGVTTDRKAKLVTLACEDQDPQFAQTLVTRLGERANEVLRSIGATSGGEEARFLERRVVEVQREADDAAQSLREFEESNKVVDLDAQSRAVVSSLSSLRGQQISKELELRYMKGFSSPSESSAGQLRRQLGVIAGQLHALEQAPEAPRADAEPRVSAPAQGAPQAARKAEAEMFPPALLLPGLQYEMSQRVRDRNLSEGNLILLKQRLEMAKAAAARDISAFQVVDAASLPSSKHRPRGTLALAAGLALGLLAGVAWAFGGRYARAARDLVLREDREPRSRTTP
jgi:capsule polysaccharide export protein KpsE/RkpR